MNINALATNLNGSANPSSSAAQRTAEPSQRDMFMTLLVTQLKNQDPLQPQDGAAFVAQLAQFNSLDQLVGIRQSIEQLTAALQHPNTPTVETSATKPRTVVAQIKSV